MRKIHFVLILYIFFVYSCKSDFKHFQDQAVLYAADNKQISQKEYENLLNEIKASEERGFQQFKSADGKIDDTKVVAYLLKYLAAKKINISIADIMQQKNRIIENNFNINVFLENSGSMDGYLNDPNTSFKNTVYSLLTRLKLFADNRSLNLYYVNKVDKLLYRNASNDDLEKFKNILNPASFNKISGGNTGITDLNELIKRCLNKTNEGNLSVFISDCIYSPGKSVKDAAIYLAEQKQGIFLNFATELKSKELSLIILQVLGNFKGQYYDRYDHAIQIKNSIPRPFYIWFIGTRGQIEAITKSKKLEEIEGGYTNKLVIQTIKEIERTKFKILPQQVNGKFDISLLPQKIITKPAYLKDGKNKGSFGFSIAADFLNNLQDSKYFLNPSNYELSDKRYILSIDPIDSKTNNPALKGYSHILNFKTTSLNYETLKIDVIGKVPDWVSESNSLDDSRIAIDISECKKTFGIESLIKGVGEAFYPKSNANTISTIELIIKK